MGLTTKEISSSSFNDMISSVDRRSEYVENRAGANVRLNNFLTPYTLDDKSSILNAPCGYSNGVYASLRPIETFGPELITNGDFATDTDWTKGTGWSIANGKASRTAQSGSTACDQSISLIAGKKYKIVYTLTISAGSFNVRFSGTTNVNGLSRTTSGTYVDYLVAATGNNTFRLIGADGSFVGSIDNVSVKEVTDADFDFSRGSAATRVTKDGLIKNVQILSGELLQNGDFSQIGNELIPDGNFTNQAAVDYWQIADTGGVERATKSLENGFMRLTYDIANGSALLKSGIVTSGKSYKVTFRAKGTANSNFHSIGDNVNIPSNPQYVVSNPTLTNDWQNYEFYVPVSSTTFRLYLTSAQIGDTLDITNISVKEVGQNWTFIGNANIIDGAVSYIDDGTNTNSYCSQSTILTSGKKYKISFDVIRYVSGLITVETGSIATNVDISNGIGTYNIEAEANNTFVAIKRNGSSPNFDFDISNISVIEITDDTDLPRIDYTNGTGSLLLEPQSTNLITYSEDFSDSSWSRSGTITQTDNYGISPDGKRNSTRLQLSNNAIVYKGLQAPFDGARSLYVKATSGSGTIQLLSHYTNTDNIFTIDENWQRVELTDVQQISQNFYLVDTRGGSNTTIFDIEVWGAQYELLDYATSYIPTSGSTVTRNADVCNNAGNSDLINSTEGCFYLEASKIEDDGVHTNVTISDGTNNNRIIIGIGFQSSIEAVLIVSGSTQSFYSSSNYPVDNYNKIAFSYKLNQFKLFINGSQVGVTDTSGLVFPSGTLSELNFADGDGAGSDFYGNVRSVAVFKEALTDEELAKITSTTQQEAFYEMRDKMLQINADYYEFGDYTTRLKKLF